MGGTTPATQNICVSIVEATNRPCEQIVWPHTVKQGGLSSECPNPATAPARYERVRLSSVLPAKNGLLDG